MERQMEPCQLIERSIIKKYRKELWTPFIVAVKRYELVQAGDKIAVCISGGKDSIVLADLTYKLIQAGEINPSQLTVLFVDEEAIFDSIEATTKAWRKKFLLSGAKFQWWCIEVKHFSCLNELSSDETFVCWDRRKRDVWVRQPPPFAIRNHPLLKPGVDNYQSFLPRVTMDGIMITGVRAAESIQRLQYMAALNMGAKGITGTNTIYPIYDWKTADVWLYLRDQGRRGQERVQERPGI